MTDVLRLVSTDPYSRMYDSLTTIRELFHSEGHFSDSNAKLDEIAKLIAVRVGQIAGITSQRDLSDRTRTPSIALLSEMFAEVARASIFRRGDGESIFGPRPALALRPGDERIAGHLAELASLAVQGHPRAGGIADLDPLNEAFGHFVRDNFRNNTEDAQYMTPPEVVSLMTSLAVIDIESNPGRGEYIVADPSCGVGSLLLSFSRAYEDLRKERDMPKLKIVGQDKVDRMTTLAFMNLSMFREKRAWYLCRQFVVG